MMNEGETGDAIRSAGVIPFPASRSKGPVTFDRKELGAILNLYGRMVADGEWRDYGIDFARERAVFSVFRRTSELPLFRIVKDPKLARRQGMYSVETTVGTVLKRGPDLLRVLRVLEKPLRLVTN